VAKETQPPPEISADDARRLADSVRKIEKGMKELNEAGLNRKAIVVLLAESTGVSRRDINAVLNGLETLGSEYLEKAK
jgi:ribosomal protein L7Ae-like RNA K-turn-binding protein